MTSRQADPRKLDMASFAADAGVLEGHWPLAGFARLNDGSTPQEGSVDWSVRGQQRAVAGGETEIWLHFASHARVTLVCQRCLQPLTWDLDIVRPLRFVAGEGVAAALDADSEDDVLELTRSLDLHELVEDELLLALPLVPMHEQCPTQVQAAQDADKAPDGQRANPFAALAMLKRASGGDGTD